MRLPSRPSQRGSTLIVAVFVVALMSVIIGVALDYTNNTARMAVRGRDLTSAQSIADGAIEAAYMGWQQYMIPRSGSAYAKSANNGFTSAADFDGITGPIRTSLNTAVASSGFTVSKLVLRAVDQADSPLSYQDSKNQTTGPLQDTPGWIANSLSYRALAVVTKTGTTLTSGDKLVVSVSRFFQQADAPLCQAMLFWQNDLELHPGAPMTLYGLVHTNADMYAVAGAGKSLTFTSNVSYAGNNSSPAPAKVHPANFYQSKGDGTYMEGVTQTLYDQEGSWNSYVNPSYNAGGRDNQLSEVSPLDPLGLSTMKVDPTNPNDTGTHEVIERPVPVNLISSNLTPSTIKADTTYPDAISNHRLFDGAGVRVLINRNAPKGAQVVHVYYPTGSTGADSQELVPSGKAVSDPSYNLADALIAAVTPAPATSIFTDARQGTKINVDDVDVSKLSSYLSSAAYQSYLTGNPLAAQASYNGVLYVSDVTNTDTNPRITDPTGNSIANPNYGQAGSSDAIRLKNGGIVPDAGMTMVSDGAVYIQGDFNTGTKVNALSNTPDPTTYPNSDLPTGNPNSFTYNGYIQKPAAVIGDAVMVLSNSWVDASSNLQMNQTTGVRIATPTTVNAAIVAGQVLTDDQNNNRGSGGAHNFPRFLEDWSGKNFTYHGSMSQLYKSEHFTAPYGNGGVYNAPNRVWYFDTRLLTNPIPGNLRATNYVRGRWTRNSLSGNELQ